MKLLLAVFLSACLMSCASERPHIRYADLPHFGDALPGTMQVTAFRGFERPGHYHLPPGATLGLLTDLAGLIPIEPCLRHVDWCWNFLDIGRHDLSKPRLRVNRENGNISASDRKLRLQDRDCVRRNSMSL